jgi:hypothetical protein
MGLIMGDEISEHSSACHKKSCKILWVPIMPGTRILWVRDFFYIFEHSITFWWVCFAGEMPACNILYNLLWVQEDERRARIVNPVEKTWMQQGLNL